jgi:hypothetical protein
VNLMGDYTSILGQDRSTRALLISLKKTRNEVAHPREKISPHVIINDTHRFAELAVALWPRLFGGERAPAMRPVTMAMVSERAAQPRRAAPPLRTRSRASKEPQAKLEPLQRIIGALKGIWLGESPPRRWLWRLGGALAVGLFAGLTWRSAVALAPWPAPMKTVSLLLVVVAALLFAWSVRLLWRVVRFLGLRRLLIGLGVLYMTAVGLSALVAERAEPLPQATLSAVTAVAGRAWRSVTGFTTSLIEAPATFRTAYTGRRTLTNVPGMEANPTPMEGKIIEPLVWTELGEPTPEVMVPRSAEPPDTAEPDPTVGDQVEVRGTRGERLRARAGPGIGYEIVTRFPEGTRLRVVDGPVKADGYVWWRVRGEAGEGWCAGRWLAPMR